MEFSETLLRQSCDDVFELYRLMRKISREIEKFRDRVASSLQVTGAELYIFWNIHTLKRCTYSRLADHSGVANNTISVLVKSLVRKGYVQQHPDPNDGRVTRLTLTDRGEELAQAVIQSVIQSPASRLVPAGRAVCTPSLIPRNALGILNDILKIMTES